MVYFLIFIFFLLVTVLNLRNKVNDIYFLSFFLSFIILVFFAGTRFETGSDWLEYQSRFKDIPPLDELITGGKFWSTFELEIGFEILCSFVKMFGGTVQSVFFISTFFNVTLLFWFYKKYSPIFFITVFCFFAYSYIQYNFAVVRQALAFPFLLIAIDIYYTKPRLFKLKIFLCLLSGALFHYSIFPLVLIFFLPLRKRLSTFAVMLIIASSIILMFALNLSTFKDSITLFSILSSGAETKLTGYLEEGDKMSGVGINLGLLLKLFLLLFALSRRRVLEIMNKDFTFIFNLFLLSFFIYTATLSIPIISIRYTLYMVFTQDLILACIVFSFIDLRVRIILIFLLVLPINLYYYSAIRRDPTSVLLYFPYKNYILK